MPKCLTLALQGDHYAMGRQHGHQVRRLRPLIAQAIEARFSHIEQYGPDARFEALLRETHELLQDIGPLQGRPLLVDSPSWSRTGIIAWGICPYKS